MNTAEGMILPKAPFEYHHSLRFLGFFAPMQGEQTIMEQTLIKAVYVEEQVVAFQLQSLGTTTDPRLHYTLFSEEPISSQIQSAAEDRIQFFLSLYDDLEPFYQRAADDPDFAPILQELYGYHQVKFLTPFENACWAVLTQRNPQVIAQRMKQNLIKIYGGSVNTENNTYFAFPTASRLASASQSELNSIVHNERKAEYLAAVIQAFTNVDEQYLRTAPYAEVYQWLRSIRGFGEWSATFVLLRGLGRTEQVPLTEKQLKAVVSRVYGRGKDLTDQEVTRLAERYGPYQGYWAHYLRIGG